MDRHHPLLAIANAISGGHIENLTEAVELYGNMAFTNQANSGLLEERILELEMALEDQGWIRMDGQGSDTQFSKAALDKINQMARVYWLKNPLIKRAVATQASYVFAQGVDIVASDDTVQDLIDDFMDDTKNRAELTSQQAMVTKETELQVTANLFFTFFTDRGNGATRVRTIPMQEISRIIYNPEDGKEPWYYYRKWSQPKEAGSQAMVTRQAMYPDINYMPKTGLPRYFNGVEVMVDNPVYHVKTNCLSDMDFGVSEVYAAIDWAKAYKDFLEDWYTLVKSLSKFAWKATSKAGATGLNNAKQAIEGALNPANPDLPGTSGKVWMSSDNMDLSPMPKSGATVSVDDGRRALLMVSAATGIFEHYFGDPQTGNRATTQSMEEPMLFMFRERQQLWVDIFSTILNYVIDQSALKPGGRLSGAKAWNDYGEMHVDTGELDRGINVAFPDIMQEDINERIDAIVKAVTLSGQDAAGTIDLKTATVQLLTALGEDTDIVDTLFPDDPKSWVEIDEEKQQKALEIAQGQQSAADQQSAQAAKAASATKKAEEDSKAAKNAKEPEEKAAAAAGEQEEAYLGILDRMVSELRERGI